jgi:hypothetical protein
VLETDNTTGIPAFVGARGKSRYIIIDQRRCHVLSRDPVAIARTRIPNSVSTESAKPLLTGCRKHSRSEERLPIPRSFRDTFALKDTYALTPARYEKLCENKYPRRLGYTGINIHEVSDTSDQPRIQLIEGSLVASSAQKRCHRTKTRGHRVLTDINHIP